MAASKLQALCVEPPCRSQNHCIVAVHFWAPTFKWGISIANIADFSKPPEKTFLSPASSGYMHWTDLVTLQHCNHSGMFDLYKNWNLFAVNLAMAGTGLYQLSRKLQHDYFSEAQAVVAQE
ncbi:mitochondrial pyruvate carrier 4 [Citrus sinensis]|uniref:Mitochondrial pyruvate carrier 4 n=1 Tax=Citrus sinensis TaxID=2711 RepID=A0ACB8NIT6_CITSI|nr:mitochondrial pyruvate carrier 4 [Citrus sinensis]